MALYTQAELKKKELAELRDLAKSHSIPTKDKLKKDLIEDLLDIEEELEDEEEELEDEELEEELEAEDEEDDIEEEAPAPKKSAKSKKSSTPAKKTSSKGENTLAAKQVATLLGTEAKVLRQFFRSPASTVEAVGSGGRYEFLESDVPTIKAEFEKWRSEHAARGSKRGEGKAGKSTKPVEEIEEVEDIEELEEEEELDDEIDDEDLELEDED